MTPLLLLAVAAACALWLPGRLARASWPARSPRLGVVALLTAAYTALASVTLAGVTMVILWRDTHHLLRTAWQLCVDALSGAHGVPARLGALAGATLLLAVGYRLAVGAWPVGVVGVRRRRAHAEMLDVIGLPSPVPGVTVLPHPGAAAYVLPGRQPRVVITTGALDALDPDQADAVLAHERAHVHGRHHHIAAASRLLATAFGRVRPLRLLDRQVARLIEMHADDVAVRGRHSLTLAGALVAMAEAGTSHPGPGPAGTLNATGSDVTERLNRLLYPPPPLHPVARLLILASAAALAAAPALLVLLRPLAS